MLSHAQNLVDNWEFSELWIDPTASPPYVLILLGDSSGNSCVYDPNQNYELAFSSDSYEEAKLWLLEDEYERVEGRLTASVAA
ncbi:hypothetical protein A2T98_22160 [Nodularia spumigena CENA596]|uniref:Uncharacterized protein n=1 Tax=Nodularia spumigena CENA596 TaxID=1819295 RepID=A0A166HYZ2_NODSP|nr:hypothetical protein [Nodularia spumigena]KZL47632.1 hypothetical protein A2T98_22160 [Nodularia spumigena CENA596]